MSARQVDDGVETLREIAGWFAGHAKNAIAVANECCNRWPIPTFLAMSAIVMLAVWLASR